MKRRRSEELHRFHHLGSVLDGSEGSDELHIFPHCSTGINLLQPQNLKGHHPQPLAGIAAFGRQAGVIVTTTCTVQMSPHRILHKNTPLRI